MYEELPLHIGHQKITSTLRDAKPLIERKPPIKKSTLSWKPTAKAPENGWLEDEIPFWDLFLAGAM